MLSYFFRRLALAIPALLGVITISFFLVHAAPGDPVDFVMGEQAEARDKEVLRHELGLDRSLIHQYLTYLREVSRLNFGRSVHGHDPVFTAIANSFPATLELSLAALFMAVIWGLPLGAWAAIAPQSALSWLGAGLSWAGMSLPGVLLGPLLVYLFAMRLDWLPVSERGGFEHLLLPSLSLALPLGAVIWRMTRATLVEVIHDDYLRTARAKGAPEVRVYFGHALRNALSPIVTIVGLQLGAMLTGTVITETIFDWPGLGTLLYTSIQRRDYPMVQGGVLFVACIYVFVNLLTDLTYGWVDPRVRAGQNA